MIRFHASEAASSHIFLQCMRIVSSGALSILGAFLIHNPDGILGARETLSTQALYLNALWIILMLASISGCLTRQPWTTPLACLLAFTSAVIFGIVIPHDPLRAGALVFCQAYFGIVSSLYNPVLHTTATKPQDELPTFSYLDLWMSQYRKTASHIILLCCTLALLTFGFKITQHPLILKVILMGCAIAWCIAIRLIYLMVRWKHKTSYALVLLSLTILAPALHNIWGGILSEVLIFLFFVGTLAYLISQGPLLRDTMEGFQSAPALFVLLSFGFLVGAGTLFLCLPAASAQGSSLPVMQALFTAVSASCVTGLSVVNISETFSEFGLFIILILMQMGGLGIMVLSTFATLAFGGKLGVRTEKAFSEFFYRKGMKSTYQLITFIVVFTISIELVGACILSYLEYSQGTPLGQAIKTGIFQAVSAFCNAGFSLTENSLHPHLSSPVHLMIYGVLIVLGGLGFVVLFEITSRVLKKHQRVSSMSVQSKLVLLMTAIFIVGGTVAFAVIEWNGALAALEPHDKISNSLFYSITLRTAGFHTVSPQAFSYASWVIMLFFMFVGGAPSGTAGGVKVTTFATLLATLPTLVRNDNRVTIYARNFPLQTVAKSSALIILYFASMGVMWFLLLLTQEESPMKLLFEIFSAMGTVGLTLGSTETLDVIGQVILMCGMFIGRIGPLTLAIALAQDTRSRINYPNADVMIG